MKDSMYKEFGKIALPIVKKCTASKEMAEKNSERYGIYYSKTPALKKLPFYYDKIEARKPENVRELQKAFTAIPEELIYPTRRK